ncbi:MAG: Nicotinamide riboside transporter PnuC [Opitutia bacterium UBA7350]|nr:MAG: Nicotinamide riboside transporter PnuC [Opitutae bacterium UBA7350]
MIEYIWSHIASVSIAELLGMISGVTGVYLSIKEKVLAWPFFIICYFSYVYLSWQASYYSNLLLNIVFIFISIYGWINWSKTSIDSTPKVSIGSIPPQLLVRCILFILFFSILLGRLADQYSQAYLPYLDALATSCAFVAQWMLSRKYLQNWIFWILADCILTYLWVKQGYYVSTALFLIFIVLAFRGLREWSSTIRTQSL